MANLRLTDISLAQATAITPTTLIHIVTTADTTQFSGGSSYKVQLGQLSSLFSGSPQVYTTAFTYNNNNFTISDNSGNTFNQTVNEFSGLTINGNLNVTGDTILNSITANTISATTYQNLPIDPDTYVTAFTYNNNTFTIFDNSGSTFSQTVNDFTGLTINGGLSATTLSAVTIGSSGDCVDDLYVSNIHSCSPLYINPLSEGNVYVGSANTLTVDLINQRVGIGVTNPVKKLHISGGTSTELLVQGTGADSAIIVDSEFYPHVYLKTNGNTDLTINGNGTGNSILGVPTSIQFRDNSNVERFLMSDMNTANSFSSFRHNVGFDLKPVGFTPSAAVHIRGFDNTSSNYGLKVESSGGTNNLYIKNDGETQFGTGFKILPGGNAASVTGSFPIYGGFGGSFETNYLGVNNIIGINGDINFNNSGFSKISSNGSNQIGYSAIGHHYFSNGNVGISVVNPSEKLEVSGRTKTINFTMTSGATNDYILKSDSSGNASWSSLSGITGVVNKYTITAGFTASVTQTITHNLNTKYVHCSVWDQSNDQLITAQVVRTLGNINNAVDITIATTGTYDILITG